MEVRQGAIEIFFEGDAVRRMVSGTRWSKRPGQPDARS
jgi:hypothetical protein